MDIEEILKKCSFDEAALGRSLINEVQDGKKHLKNDDDWIDETFDINFWEFKKNSFSTVCWFQVLMDNSVWDDLAYKLGLNTDEIEWCRTYHKQGPTKEIFSRLALKGELESLSLGKVLDILRNLSQKAILSRVNWQESIKSFRDTLAKGHKSNRAAVLEKSGYRCGMNVSPSDIQGSLMHRIHQAPEVLVSSGNMGEVKSEQVEEFSHSLKTEKTLKSKFAAKIIIMFASDAKEEALRAASQLKATNGERKEIGVMILTQPYSQKAITDALSVDPGNSIQKWFKQVDFVVPVLSRQFLQQIQDRDSDPDTLEERQYNRYLYRLVLDDYVTNMSKNYKCRALYIPEDCSEVCNSEIVKGNGLFQVNWACSSEHQVEQLAEILISGAAERRKARRRN